jgi:ABC-2 type transport system ATP-binding protein
VIEVKNVVKTFDGFPALDGLTLTVPSSAVYGMVGPNGAGKSTIIRHIVGIYKQDSGDVLVDGQPVFENCRRKKPHCLHTRRSFLFSLRPRSQT